jgi:hypothetical protein
VLFHEPEAPAGCQHHDKHIEVLVRYLRGLKENVTMGRLIPAGTGFEYYRHVRIPADGLPRRSAKREGGNRRDPAAHSEGLELEREMEYFVEPDEAFTRDVTRYARCPGLGTGSRDWFN